MITINGKEYRNLQEQVQKNMEDIAYLKETPIVDAYSKEEADDKFATKNEIPTRTSDLINDSFVTTSSTQYITASKIFKTTVDASIGASIYPSSGSFYTEKDGTSTSFAPQKISLSKSSSATPFNFQIYSSQGEGHSGVYTFDNSVTGTVTTKEYVDSTVGNKQDTLVSGTNIKTINGLPILGQGNISISGSGTAGTGIDITNNVISVDTDFVVTKDSLNNVDGALQVEHLQSEIWEEEDDNKADIYLYSGLRKSRVTIQTSGEESGSSIILQGTTSVGSEGTVQISGETTFNTKNRISVYDGTTLDEIAYLSDLNSRKTRKYKFAINLGVSTEVFVRTFYADQGAYPTGTISDYSTAMTYLHIGDIFYCTEDSCIYTFGGAGQTVFMRKYDGTYYERNGQYPPVASINITITQLD